INWEISHFLKTIRKEVYFEISEHNQFNGNVLGKVPGDQTSWKTTNLRENTMYLFSVKAVAIEASVESDPLQFITPLEKTENFVPSPPRRLSKVITLDKKKMRHLVWNSPERCLGHIGYEITFGDVKNSVQTEDVFFPLHVNDLGEFKVRTVCRQNDLVFKSAEESIFIYDESLPLQDNQYLFSVILLTEKCLGTETYFLRPFDKSFKTKLDSFFLIFFFFFFF
ncbi:hypothetical protein RFI_15830, partial [Reticulomyxa filosa]